jgi:DNA-binding NarL/FixJ family response regulator
MVGSGQGQSHYRILVVDDHPAFRRMLRSFVEQNSGWEVCGEASDGWEAVKRTTELQPDIILMDLDMPRLNGLEATRRIHRILPSIRILILTLHDNTILPRIAQESGAQGYVLKSESFDVLNRAIETMGSSDRFFVSSNH